MRIGLDLDGVCYPWDRQVRAMLEDRFCYVLGDPVSWDYFQKAIEPEHWRWLWSEGIEAGMFRDGGTYPGVREAVQRLSGYGEIVVITHRPESAAQDTYDWLAFNRIPASEVHITAHGAKSQFRCDVYIDDAGHVAEELLANTQARVLLWSKMYNEYVQSDDPRLTRVASWDRVIHEVELMSELVPA